jgi:hypothetical protein
MCVFPFAFIRLKKRIGARICVIKLALAHKGIEGTVQLFRAEALQEKNSHLLICYTSIQSYLSY